MADFHYVEPSEVQPGDLLIRNWRIDKPVPHGWTRSTCYSTIEKRATADDIATPLPADCDVLCGYPFTPETCHLQHRWPEGSNEDVGPCRGCGELSWELRPDGEPYGDHLPDCSLPRRHERGCEPGGAGHPRAAKIRGYWGVDRG